MELVVRGGAFRLDIYVHPKHLALLAVDIRCFQWDFRVVLLKYRTVDVIGIFEIGQERNLQCAWMKDGRKY